MTKFIHLHVHSEYSIVNGIVRIKPLMQHCRQMRSPAVAVTDLCNFFSGIKSYTTAIANGIKPILGAELPLGSIEQVSVNSHAVFLCQNETGYRNLTCLISKAYQKGQVGGKLIVDMSWLAQYSEGLIVLSGALKGNVAQALASNDDVLAVEQLQHWLALFPNRFYFEVTRTNREGEQEYINKVLPLAEKYLVPIDIFRLVTMSSLEFKF